MTKVCTKCGKEKPATTEYFYVRRTCKDGLNTQCNKCCKEYRKEYHKKNYRKNKVYLNKKSKEWAEENRERMLQLQKDWYEKNYPKNKDKENARSKEYFRENPNYRKEYYTKNKEHHNKLTAKWHQENKERHSWLNKRWLENNREKANLQTVKYQHLKKMLPFDFSLSDWEVCLDYFDNSCAYCGDKESDLEKEHFIPVSKGGGYTKDNIIPACSFCNSSKLNRDFKDWYPGKLFYSKERELSIYKYLKKKSN